MKDEHTTICSLEMPTGTDIDIIRRRFRGGAGPRVALVAGIRGDAPEGIHVLHEVTLRLRRLSRLAGSVDIFPCANPLAAHNGARRWPFFDVDLNRTFPGRPDGHPPERVAYHLVESLQGMDLVVEVRGANQAFREIPQAHVRQGVARETELAQCLGVDVVWQRALEPSSSAAFVSQFPTSLALEGGTGTRLTLGVGQGLADAVLRLLVALGVVHPDDLELPAPRAVPRLVSDRDVNRVRVTHGGLFLPALDLGQAVNEGDVLGQVVDPTVSEDLEWVRSPVAGLVMAVREQPVVHPGSMVARVVEAVEA